MKILVVCQLYYPENVVITNIAEKLAYFGHEVTVLTGKPNYGYGHILKEYKKVKHEERNGVSIERVKLIARRKTRLSVICNYLSFLFSSRRWVRHTKKQFDVVYSFSISPVTILSAGNLYKKKHHVKHVVHCVDLWPESVAVTNAVRRNSLMFKMLYRWSKKLYSGTDEIIIGSPSYEEYFKNVLKITDKKLTYIPQSSLVENYDGMPYQYNNKSTNILYCGNIGILQGVEMIPEIMSQTKSDVIFHVIGMGPKTNKLLENIKKYNVENKVVYHGAMGVKESSKYLAGANALYISLRNEGIVGKTIPNKVMISMAFSKPIIAMIDGDGKDILEQAKGSLICAESAENIAKTIDNFVNLSCADKEIMAKNNHQYYVNNFSQDSVSRQVEKRLLENNAID